MILVEERHSDHGVFQHPQAITLTTGHGLTQKFDIQGIPTETARRATFLIDKSGKIINEQVDAEAVDPTKTVEACERHKLKN